jgi:toxin-antitoxin system PIN domain toxin
VILVDANLLVYAYVDSFPQHAAARDWLDARLTDTPSVGLPWASVLGFVRLVTNPRVFERPASLPIAWQQAQTWLDCRPAWIPLPTVRHREMLSELLAVSGLRANHVPDAHLAALALEHGLVLCSTDNDFKRFPGLRFNNPIA